jgi:DNA repair and recombination protein RAD54B
MTWNGLRLHSGYATRIGGKDVELDSQIKASQMPDIIGSIEEHDVDEEMDEPQSQAGPSFLLQSFENDPESAVLSSAPKFVAPTSFYGQAAPKPKPKGPLLVLNSPSRLSRV